MPQAAILDLTLEQLEMTLAAWGEPPYRARQVWDHLYLRWASTWDKKTGLPIPLRESRSSNGQTLLILNGLADGTSIETVLMSLRRAADLSRPKTPSARKWAWIGRAQCSYHGL